MVFFLLIVSLAICALGLMMMFDDPIIGIFVIVVGIFVGRAGLDYKDVMNQLHDTQQQVLSIQNGHRVELRALAKDLAESQSKAKRLTAENQLLKLQQDSCVSQQKVSQDTLSGIKEILEN